MTKKRKKTISETVIENEDVNDHDDNESIFLGKKWTKRNKKVFLVVNEKGQVC